MLGQLLGIPQKHFDCIISTYLSKQLYETILPKLMRYDPLATFQTLKGEYINSLIKELEEIHSKLGIEVTEKIKDSWKTYLKDFLI